MRECSFITIINCFAFFYQWRIHFTNRHKLTIVSYREQKFFNIVVIRYKNSFVYIQKQIDRLFRVYRAFARVYVDNIVIFFKFLKKHILHLRQIFDILAINNISIKSKKVFLEYFTVRLLDQKIDSLDLFIFEKKLKTIAKIQYFIMFQILETYLDLTS